MSMMELKSVESSSPLMRSLTKMDSEGLTEERVSTAYGEVFVGHQGMPLEPHRPVIITYHDIGLNYVANFQAFFNYMDMKLLLQSFCVFHMNAPGMEENAAALPDNYVYPSMDQMAEQIGAVCKHFSIKTFIGFGVGLGANILCRYALRNPDAVDGLFLVNPTSTQSTWTEWLYQKMNVYYLSSFNTSTSFPQAAQDYLMWHHFGKVTEERNRDLVETYRNYFSGKTLNARNLSLLIDAYIKRTDLGIIRGDKEHNFKCSVLVLCGALSPHVEDTVTMNSRLDPSNSTWMKLSDCAMVLDEQPAKVSEAFRLFLQGLGYALTAYERRRSSLRKMSSSSASGDLINGNTTGITGTDSRKNSIDEELSEDTQKKVHIVENPIASS